MKFKLSDFIRVAGELGYTGEKTPDAVRAFLIVRQTAGAFEPLDDKDQPLDLAKIEFEDDTKPVKRSAKFTAAAAGAPVSGEPSPQLTIEIDSRVKAGVEQALRSMGMLTPEGRPNLNAQVEVQVKEMEQVVFEDEAKAGKTSFRTYGAAAAWREFFLHKCRSANQQHEVARKHLEKYQEISKRNGVSQRAMTEGSVTGGSAIVPEQFLPEWIRLVNKYGVARRLARRIPMTSNKLSMPRATGRVTIFFPSEGGAASESSPTSDQISLEPRTAVGITKFSKQLMDDAALSVIDWVYTEMAWAHAKMEDDAFFIGDGSSTYGTMRGFLPKFGTSAATDGGYIVVGGGTALAHTTDHLNSALARVPDYARDNMFIVCNPQLSPVIFDRLAEGKGGVTMAEVTGFGFLQKWRNIPIIPSNSLPSATDSGGDTIDFLIGDFSLAAKFGDRQSVEFDMNDRIYWDELNIGIRSVARYDVNVHDIGTASVAGPVVSFWQT